MKMRLLFFAALLQVCALVYPREKEIYIPEGSIKSNKFNEPDGKFSHEYKAESENLVIFWDKSFGKDPAAYPDKSKRFYPEEILKEGERFYAFYRDKCKFVKKGSSYTDKYKMIIWMYNDDVATAYGGGDDVVGMAWFRPCRINSYPYCTLAHELGHSFQYMVKADGQRGFYASSFGEYTSQWMLWQVYSDWTTIEKFHLDAFMKQTNLEAFHKENCYHAPQLMEYWSEKHGTDIIGRVWREAQGEEGQWESAAEWEALLEQAEQSVAGVAKKGMQAIRLRTKGYSTREIGEILGAPDNHVTAWEARARKLLRSMG